MPIIRPEQRGEAQAFYGSEEASRYSNCHQTHQKQTEITEVALQLLDLPVRGNLHKVHLTQSINLILTVDRKVLHRLDHSFCSILVVDRA